MGRTRHPEWQQSHEGTKYPFADNATLTNDAGLFIPETLLLDAAFYPIGGGERLFLSKIVLTHETATLYLGDATTDELASAEFELLSPPDNALFVDAYDRPAGIAVSEPTRLASLQSWTVGTHEFTVAQTEFAATCCLPTPQVGVRGFILDDGSVMTGDVVIVGRDGILLSTESVVLNTPGCLGESSTYTVLRIHAVGDPLFKRKVCGDLFQEIQFLEQITVEAGKCRIQCGANVRGDFQITGGSVDTPNPVLRITKMAGKNAIMIEAAGTKVGGDAG